MSIDLFRVMHGIDIQADDLSANANILVGILQPGGDAAEQDAAPVGSVYMRNGVETNNLQLYYKWTTVNNSAADWKPIASQDYVDAVASGLSWRNPVKVRDNTAYASSAAFPVGGIVDGVNIADGDRVLFDNVAASGENNVWIWDLGNTSWIEDSNEESDGDAVLVQEGSSADQQWVYDGSVWVQFGSGASIAELGFIRAFIGKTGTGSELPTYSSTDAVTQGSTLEVAISDLDDALGSGEIINDGGNFSLSDDMSWGSAGTLEVTDALNEINNTIGDRTYTSDNVVADGETIASSIDALDVAVGDITDQTSTFSGTNIVATAGVTVDTIPLADATQAKWIIQVRETATPANRRAVEVHAMNDGSTLVDHTEYAVLKLGSAIASFDVDVDVAGTDMRLRISATNNVDYVVRRISYTAF